MPHDINGSCRAKPQHPQTPNPWMLRQRTGHRHRDGGQSPRGGPGVMSPAAPWVLTCQASSCCERFTFCWMASRSWLLRDIMSILHLVSSTSTAFFLQGQKSGPGTFFFLNEELNISKQDCNLCLSLASPHILRGSSLLYSGKSINLKSGTELLTSFL